MINMEPFKTEIEPVTVEGPIGASERELCVIWVDPGPVHKSVDSFVGLLIPWSGTC